MNHQIPIITSIIFFQFMRVTFHVFISFYLSFFFHSAQFSILLFSANLFSSFFGKDSHAY